MRRAQRRIAAVGTAFAVAMATHLSLFARNQEEMVIRVPVPLVTVPTLVTAQDGTPITGLQQTDFHLFDNDAPETIRIDEEIRPLSIVLVVQTSTEVREYLPYIAKTSSLIENSFSTAGSETAVLTYGDDVSLKKPFDSGDLTSVLRALSTGGTKARLIDAGLRAIDLLGKRSPSRARILIVIGQSFDQGSEGTFDLLLSRAQDEGVSIFALALPTFGKSFVSDTFSVGQSNTPGRGGFKAGVELTTLIPALKHSDQAQKGADPFSLLTAATGGMVKTWRKQKQVEDALIATGKELRSLYILSFTPISSTPGHHQIKVEVAAQGATVHCRAGYDR